MEWEFLEPDGKVYRVVQGGVIVSGHCRIVARKRTASLEWLRVRFDDGAVDWVVHAQSVVEEIDEDVV